MYLRFTQLSIQILLVLSAFLLFLNVFVLTKLDSYNRYDQIRHETAIYEEIYQARVKIINLF